MNQNKTKTFRKILLCVCLSILALLPIALTFSNKNIKVEAASDVVEVTISNQDFNSSSSNSLQASPTGWTSIESASNIKQGIISVSEEAFSSNRSSYGLDADQNPGKSGPVDSDNKVLMINAQKSYAKSGFESVSDITMDANSFYVLSVNVKTSASSIASIYLNGLNEEHDDSNSFIEINSQQWTKLTYLVKTGLTSKSFKVQLYLGSKSTQSTSVVFFDNIDYFKTSEATYETIKSNLETENVSKTGKDITFRELSFNNDRVDATNQIANANFNDSTIDTLSPSKETNGQFVDVISNPKYSNLSANNAFAFAIKNETAGYGSYKLEDIKIPAYGIYAIRIDAKVIEELNGGNAYIKILEGDQSVNISPSYSIKSAEFSLTSNTKNAVKNDFNTYSFIIKANGICQTTMSLEVAIGDTSTSVSGEIAVDDIKFESLTSSEYENISNSTFNKTVDLTISTASPTVANGHFNNYKITSPVEFDSSNNPIFKFPYQTTAWEHSHEANIDENNFACGLVNTKSDFYDSSIVGIANPNNPLYNITDEETLAPNSNSNNIFMFKNSVPTYQSIKSENAVSLSSNSTYRLTFDCKTEVSSGNMFFELLYNNKPLTSFREINTNGEWKTYTVIIKTGNTSLTTSINFGLGNADQSALGFAFIDNVRAITTTMTAEKFESMYQAANTKVLDFVDGSWSIISEEANQFEVHDLLTATTTLANNAFAGVVSGINNVFEVESQVEGKHNNIIVISNPEKGTSALTTDSTISLTAAKYYEISVNIQTQRMQALLGEEVADHAVSLKLSSFETKIKNIVSNGAWTTYSFFVAPTSDTTCGLEITLSSPTSTTLGTVLCDNLVVNEITSSKYETVVQKQNSDDPLLTAAIVDITETEKESETEEEETTEEENEDASKLTNKDIWLLVPSILLGVVLIAAIIFLCLRRIKIKKTIKASTSSYDRTATLEREQAKIQAKKNIDSQLAEQKELLKAIEEELVQIENNYQEQLREFRASQSSTKSSKMEKEFKSYMSQKARLTQTATTVKDKIKSLENPEVLVLEEKRLFTQMQKEKTRVKKQVKKQTKQLSKTNKNK